jgi:hypothetical protein
MTSQETGASSADDRAHIAALLTRYPELPTAELDRLHRWFHKGATALDLGLLASDPDISEQYRAYRAEHYDRIKPADISRAAMIIGVALALIVIALLLLR